MCSTGAVLLEYRSDVDNLIGRWLQALGGSLFTAYYLAGLHQRLAAESTEMNLYLRQTAALDSYPLFYDNEAEAISWLCDQQEGAGHAPAKKARAW